ncbi:MAG TPA: APC family permease [Candidatus Acidoferrum sp.]|nr:APC family permease [Candidatus Acidoferrum sp.]
MRYPLRDKLPIWIPTRSANISGKNNNTEATNAPGATRAVLRKASLLPFVFVMYAYTTGGPFGLEDMVTTSGPGLTLLYQLFIPLFWCIPVSLVAAELTTAIPVEGGFYRWVRAGFGDFWGFQAGWWNWSASFLQVAAYAVLTTDYLSFYFPAIVHWKHYLVSLIIIGVIAWINVRGIRTVGAVSTVLEIFVLLVVAALCVIAAAKWHHNPFTPLVPPHVPPFQVFGVGLALGLWLYSGYEQVSSVAEEVENPQRSYPLALALVVPLSIATYFLPTMFSLAALGNWQQWHTGFFSDAAQLIGGPWLGFAMTVAAMITNVSLLNATVLTSTRMPSTMAEDGYLPAALSARHPHYGTPWIAIMASSILSGLLAQNTIVQLLTVYVWLRIGVTILTVLSSWRLRKTQSDLPRPFRIPWGRAGLLYVVIAPLAMSVVALVGSDSFARRWGPVPVVLGPIMYFVLRKFRPPRSTAQEGN